MDRHSDDELTPGAGSSNGPNPASGDGAGGAMGRPESTRRMLGIIQRLLKNKGRILSFNMAVLDELEARLKELSDVDYTSGDGELAATYNAYTQRKSMPVPDTHAELEVKYEGIIESIIGSYTYNENGVDPLCVKNFVNKLISDVQQKIDDAQQEYMRRIAAEEAAEKDQTKSFTLFSSCCGGTEGKKQTGRRR